MQLFTEEENKRFKEFSSELEDGNHIVEIKKIKVVSTKAGRNLVIEFIEPESKLLKTLFLSMESDKYIYLKANLVKMGIPPGIDLNEIEQEAQKLVGREAEIGLVTKISDSGKKYQNIYLNRVLSERTVLSEEIPDFDVPSDF